MKITVIIWSWKFQEAFSFSVSELHTCGLTAAATPLPFLLLTSAHAIKHSPKSFFCSCQAKGVQKGRGANTLGTYDYVQQTWLLTLVITTVGNVAEKVWKGKYLQSFPSYAQNLHFLVFCQVKHWETNLYFLWVMSFLYVMSINYLNKKIPKKKKKRRFLKTASCRYIPSQVYRSEKTNRFLFNIQ